MRAGGNPLTEGEEGNRERKQTPEGILLPNSNIHNAFSRYPDNPADLALVHRGKRCDNL